MLLVGKGYTRILKIVCQLLLKTLIKKENLNLKILFHFLYQLLKVTLKQDAGLNVRLTLLEAAEGQAVLCHYLVTCQRLVVLHLEPHQR